ncbi:VWA domain-containing protein [Atopomonas sediminilitoris]|uniref:VWA domain-containing protein n=1 Tax=Atopomonas sediminilitoris TaxID=2919919 RepID=UPI003F9B0938
MPHLERPYLLLLLLPVAIIWWYQWRHAKRLGQWQSLLPAALHPWLLAGRDQRPSRFPKVLLGLGWLVCLLALTGPSWVKLEQPSYRSSDALVIVLDTSQTMLASDLTPNRLAHAKRKVLDILESRDDALTGIVVYAGSSHTLVPLSDDLVTTRNLLDAVQPSIMPLQGSRADLGVERALKLLEQGGRANGRVLLLTSEFSDEAEQALLAQRDTLDGRLSVIGFGSDEGAPVTLNNGTLLKDNAGRIVLPRRDITRLSLHAANLGGAYSNASLDDQDIRQLGLDRRQQGYQRSQQQRLNQWHDQGYWLLIPLVLLAAFSARRGWLLALCVLTLPWPSNSYALTWDDLWLRADQQGQQLLEQEQAAAAAERFQHPAWRAEALYQAGDYAAAAKLWAQQDGASADYNRGNALAQAGELSSALDAYDEALDLDPGLTQAATNRALVEALLEQQQAEQNAQNNGQNGEPTQQDGQQGQTSNDQARPTQGQTASNADNPSSQPAGNGQAGQLGEPSAGTAGSAEPSNALSASPSGESAQIKPDVAGREQNTEDTTATPDPVAGIGQAGIEALPDFEREAALELWLKQIPDEPSELLKRKFWYQQQQESQP